MDELLVDFLATFRLTRLLTTDTFPPIRKLRDRVWQHWPPVGQYLNDDDWQLVDQQTARRRWRLLGRDVETRVTVTAHGTQAVVTDAHPLGELAGCPWCMGAYVAMFVVGARWFLPRQWDVAARALAASAVTGLLATYSG